jgi:hypothetical protein
MRRPLSSWFVGVAALLSVLCASCATSRLAPSARGQESARVPTPHIGELGQFVLVLHETPSGLVAHDWRPAEDFDLSPYKHRPRPQTVEGDFVRVVARPRDCDEENRTCFNDCMRTPLQRGFGHITAGRRGMGGKKAYCERRCAQSYDDCIKAEGRQTQEFTSVEEALAGLKNNLPLIAAGSVVIIAGTIFVTVSAGAGLVILAPLVVVTAS